jgi:hypothetical protein
MTDWADIAFEAGQTDYIERLNTLRTRAAALTDAPPGSGDVTGPASATDNRLARFNGATGKLLQNSPISCGDNGELSGYIENQITVSTTTYTITASDPSGSVYRITTASAVTITLNNDLPAGWCASVRQIGAGQVTFVVQAGGSLNHRQGHTKTAGQKAWVSLAVDSNSGTNAAWYLAGDTAA